MKHILKDIIYRTKLNFAILSSIQYRKDCRKGVLLIPAAKLNGGFGEDIMVGAFVEHFKDEAIGIYTDEIISRPDYLGENVKYISGFRYGNYFSMLKVLRSYSSVYVLGADILDGTYGKYVALDRIRILRLANALKTSSYLLGFSLSNNISSKVKKELKKVSDKTYIKLRDDESYNRVDFISHNRKLLTSDIAFLCPTQDVNDSSYESWSSQQKQIIAVCPNAIQAGKIGYEKYINDFKKLLIKFTEACSCSFVFLYHDLRPLCDQTYSDKDIAEALYADLLKSSACFLPNTIRNGLQLKWYLKPVDFTLTGRMHLGISGLTLGKPMFGIAYANKFEGLLNMFQVDAKLCLIDYRNMDSSNDQIKGFLDLLPEMKEKVTEHLQLVINKAKKNLEI